MVWARGFLIDAGTHVVGSWPLDAFLSSAADFTFTFDASPWGIGASADSRSQPIEYIISKLTDIDEEKFCVAIGSDRVQHIWDVLAVLVSLRTWSRFRRVGRFTIGVRGDNISAHETQGQLARSERPLPRKLRWG